MDGWMDGCMDRTYEKTLEHPLTYIKNHHFCRSFFGITGADFAGFGQELAISPPLTGNPKSYSGVSPPIWDTQVTSCHYGFEMF